MLAKSLSTLISDTKKKITPIVAGSRHMTIQIHGTGTITGKISLDGENWSARDTYIMTNAYETFGIDVPSLGCFVELVTTGTFTEAWIMMEG